MDIMQQLVNLSNNEWREMFVQMEREEQRSIFNRDKNLLYRYLGEIDYPEEMLYEFATINEVQGKGKTNWFVCSDGTFFTCGDCAVDTLFDSGKVVNYKFPFELERIKKYNSLSKDERIAFRINLQGITEIKAKEIVCSELGISPYKYIYKLHIKEVFLNSFDNTTETKEYTIWEEGNSQKDAENKFAYNSHKIGTIVCRGTKFTTEDNRKMKEMNILPICRNNGVGIPYSITLIDRKISLIKVEKNDRYI